MQKSIRVMQCFQINEARSYKNKNYTTEKHVAKNMKSQETHCSPNKFEIKNSALLPRPSSLSSPKNTSLPLFPLLTNGTATAQGGRREEKLF